MKIRLKLVIAFFAITSLLVLFLSFYATQNSSQIIKKEIENALNSLADQKVNMIYDYLIEKEWSVATMAEMPIVHSAFKQFNDAFEVNNTNSKSYLDAEKQFRPQLTGLSKRLKAYDLFFVSPEGNIIFSITHESDFATNLYSGPYKDTQLADVFKNAINLLETRVSRFESYAPSQQNSNRHPEYHSGFIAAPIFDNDQLIGVVAIQLRSNDYYYLSSDYTGLKRTGEVILSKKLNGSALIISPMRDAPDAAFNLSFKIGSNFAKPTQWSVSGKRGSGISIDYEGTEILAAWRNIPELNWGIVVKIDTEEAFEPVTKLKWQLSMIGLIFIGLGALIAFYISGKLSIPLIHLNKAVDGIIEGNFEQQIEVTTSDEVGALGQSFNEMSVIIAKIRKKLLDQKYALDQHSIVAMTDIEGTIIYANNKFLTISGYSHSELIGNNHRLISSGFHDKSFWTSMYKTVSKGNVWKSHVLNKSKNGELYWVDTTIVPLMEDNKVSGYIAIRTDITQQKKEQQQLADAKQLADESNKAKSEFLANMSHEIRTPMNGVIGMTTLLLDDQLGEEQREKAITIKQSAESLLTIVNDILDFSKIEAGKLELELINFDLLELMEDFAKTVSIHTKDHLTFLCPASPLEHNLYQGDPGRIRQIITNLVGNAIKFTMQGEVAVFVDCNKTDNSKHKLTFSIKDTGIGLSPEQCELLFQKFNQADNSTTRKYGGTGLGLAISKELVELMDGEISVKSTLGKGSVFSFTLTLPVAKDNQLIKTSSDLKQQKILVAVRNETRRNLIKELLNNWEIEHKIVKNSNNIIKSLEIAADELIPYSIAIIDTSIKSSEIDVVVSDIKLNERLKSLKMIAIDPNGVRGNAVKNIVSGFTSYLSTPIKQSDLYGAIAEIAHPGNMNEIKKFSTNKRRQKDLQQYKARILVVEDNIVNQKVAEGMLKKFGLSIDLVGNGEEAVTSLSDLPYDLVFMDCQMPVMDGYEASKSIRNTDTQVLDNKIPIVAMTANAMKGDKEKCLAAGMDGFISKPVSIAKLSEALEQWIGTKKLT